MKDSNVREQRLIRYHFPSSTLQLYQIFAILSISINNTMIESIRETPTLRPTITLSSLRQNETTQDHWQCLARQYPSIF